MPACWKWKVRALVVLGGTPSLADMCFRGLKTVSLGWVWAARTPGDVELLLGGSCSLPQIVVARPSPFTITCGPCVRRAIFLIYLYLTAFGNYMGGQRLVVGFEGDVSGRVAELPL